ncbi:MAG: polysaccharide biosynthesis tyrosine autokinase [Acidobacteria bacterium]|nr:polysaccharide biosynthesis tyrosine autokinase [Acidobacteriota bacterium]
MAAETTHEQRPGLLSQFQQYLYIVLKWKWISIIFFGAVIVLVMGYSFLVKPSYTASGSIWIENDTNILPFEGVESFGTDSGLQSNARLLQSRALAADTIEKLKLYANPDFARLARKTDISRMPEDPVLKEKLIAAFLKNVEVAFTDRSQLVDVKYSSHSPKLAADILNALLDGYFKMIIRKKSAASEQASEFLGDQVQSLRTEIEAKERELNSYGSEKDILPLTAAETPTVTRIAEVNRALTNATIDRINKFNTYNQLKSAPLGEIPNAPEGSLIERLRTEYINLSRQYATRLATVKPEFPAMQRLKSELDAATDALQTETQNLIRIAFSEYQAALQNEQSLQRLLATRKGEAYKENSNSVIFNSLRIELDNKKSLLEALLRRQSETDVTTRLESLDALNVWIVDKADYPLKPSYPDKMKNALLALLVGLGGAIGLALGLEYLNQTVRTTKDVTQAVSLPTLGHIPAFVAEGRRNGPGAEFAKIRSMIKGESSIQSALNPRAGGAKAAGTGNPERPASDPGHTADQIELIASREPQSIQSESYRSIRTTLLVSSPPGKIKTILFTSPLAREGKSSTVSNLAISFAESGKQVAVVDADLRKPKQARLFGMLGSGTPGLSQYLSSEIDPAEIVQPTGIPNLSIIKSGPLPANPIELLSSEKMDRLVAYLKRGFDFAMFDTPPLLAVSDALAMGPMADAIILVVRGSQTPIPALRQARAKLDAHKLKCLGVILNEVDLIEQDGYYARQYYSYTKTD